MTFAAEFDRFVGWGWYWVWDKVDFVACMLVVVAVGMCFDSVEIESLVLCCCWLVVCEYVVGEGCMMDGWLLSLFVMLPDFLLLLFCLELEVKLFVFVFVGIVVCVQAVIG